MIPEVYPDSFIRHNNLRYKHYLEREYCSNTSEVTGSFNDILTKQEISVDSIET